jgi:hypothetical protein
MDKYVHLQKGSLYYAIKRMEEEGLARIVAENGDRGVSSMRSTEQESLRGLWPPDQPCHILIHPHPHHPPHHRPPLLAVHPLRQRLEPQRHQPSVI